MPRLAQIPFVDPRHLVPDIAGGIREGLQTASSLLDYLKKNKEMKRQESMQGEISKADEDYQGSLKTPPAMPEKPSPMVSEWSPEQIDQYQEMAGLPVSPLDKTITEGRSLGMVPGQITDEQANKYAKIVEKNYGGENPWAAKPMGPAPQSGLLDVAEARKYEESAEKIKSYPFEKRAEYTNKLKDIYIKYGETDKANDLDRRFLDTIKTLAGFSPTAAANLWNKSYPEMRIEHGDVKRLNTGKPVVIGPNRDGIANVGENGQINVVREPTPKTEKPKTKLEYGTDDEGNRTLYELKPGESLPEGVVSDKDLDLAEKRRKEAVDDVRQMRREEGVERRHKETLAGTESRFQRGQTFQKEKEAKKDVEKEEKKSNYVNFVGWDKDGKEVLKQVKWDNSEEMTDLLSKGFLHESKYKGMDELGKRIAKRESMKRTSTPAKTPSSVEPRKTGESIADYLKRIGK